MTNHLSEDELIFHYYGETDRADESRVESHLAACGDCQAAQAQLRHVEGMSIDEVGEKLGMKTSATKHSIFRAVKKMRHALEPFVQA